MAVLPTSSSWCPSAPPALRSTARGLGEGGATTARLLLVLEGNMGQKSRGPGLLWAAALSLHAYNSFKLLKNFRRKISGCKNQY